MKNITKTESAFPACLLGGAVGDALGYAVEFTSADAIFRTYGALGITEYDQFNGDGDAMISDDTQMTLFTAEGLLAARRTGEDPVLCIHRAYLDWLRTQSGAGVPHGKSDSQLLMLPEMHSLRAPGNTCLSALESGECGTLENPINRSKGCGGIMRVAPVALYGFAAGLSITETTLLGARAAAITHGHELGYIPAAMLVHILYRILMGDTLPDAVSGTLRNVPPLFPGSTYLPQLTHLLKKAILLAKDEESDALPAISSLGEGWVAEETLAMAVYAALKYSDDFEAAVAAAVNHSGDSDSVGAVLGNILGAYLGCEGIPTGYLTHLELMETTRDMALALHSIKNTWQKR